MSFADPMREAIIPIASPFLEGGEAEVRQWLADHRKDTATIPGLGVTLRFLLQTIGTEWGRKLIHPQLWVNIAQRTADRHRRSYVTVIDDLRFENEYAMVKEQGGLLVRIERPDAPRTGNTNHASEHRLDAHEFDAVILNSGGFQDLRQSAYELLDAYYGIGTPR